MGVVLKTSNHTVIDEILVNECVKVKEKVYMYNVIYECS